MLIKVEKELKKIKVEKGSTLRLNNLKGKHWKKKNSKLLKC